MAGSTVRIALLHLAPIPGALAQNRHLITQAITRAAGLGATWIITPELAVSGYTFADTLGTDWIEPQPDHWMNKICLLAAQRRITIFLSHPERDPQSGRLHNTVFAIAPDGRLAGTHRKINTLRVGSEAWSTPGTQATVFRMAPFGGVGILICADAFSPGIANSLKAQGAKVLVSSAAWAPGLHGPNGEWERCTKDTGLPLFVCNRTGADRTLDFRKAESVVAQDGRRLLSLSSERSAIFIIDWDLKAGTLASPEYQRILL
ncbi:MAG: carbon-nitrogen hydrolase family protein [Nitrospira defluvii]|nr:carbon-nitrogen hydrolase family protein [Nitrospira defluvii]